MRVHAIIALAVAALLALGCAPAQKVEPKTGGQDAPSSQPAPASQPAAATPAAAAAFDAAPAVGTQARCAISGKTFAVAADTLRSEHGGKHYVFCCAGCKTKFDADPAKFVTAGPGKGCGCGKKKAAAAAAAAAPASFAAAPAAGTKARCPVSGKTFDVAADSTRSEHGGKYFAFCCGGCKTKFDADPAKFAGK